MTTNKSNIHLPHHDHFPVERMLDFSDDLMAFAATLLVLSVHLPHKSELTAGQTLLSALLSQWPTYLGFFMSFVIITICWISHHNPMLPNIVMYMTSTAAQVWAALMIFEVIVMRDLDSRRDVALNDQWKLAKHYWGPLIKNLLDPNGRTLVKRLPEFGLDRNTLHQADTDKGIFLNFFKAIKKHDLIQLDGKSVHFQDRNETLSPQNWKAKLDPVASEVEKLESLQTQPANAFFWGCISIALNLAIMGLVGLYGSSDRALWITVIVIFLLNMSIGFRVGTAAYAAIKI